MMSRVLLGAVCLGAWLALLAGPARAQNRASEVYRETLPATVLIKTGPGSWGSGWVISLKHRLVITNHHVIADAKQIEVYFPALSRGKVIAEPEYYEEQADPIRGTVVDSDPKVDLALVELKSMPATAVELFLGLDTSPGESVYSIGNPGSAAAYWVLSVGTVRGVVTRKIQYKKQLVEARIVETDLAINPGDSGGPVVNDNGDLVGVISGHVGDAQLISFVIHVSEVKNFYRRTERLVNPRTEADLRARAEALMGKGRYDQAIADYTTLLKADPGNDEYLVQRARAFYLKKDYNSTLSDCDEAASLNRRNAEAFYWRARARLALKEYADALADVERAIRIDDERPEFHLERGEVFYTQDKYAEAVPCYTRVLELDPEHGLAYWYRADAYYYNGEFAKAVPDYAAALKYAQTDPVIQERMGDALVQTGKPDAALKLCQDALKKLDPDPAGLVYVRGLASEALARYEDAERDFAQAVKLDRKLSSRLKTYYAREVEFVNNGKEPVRVTARFETPVGEDRWEWRGGTEEKDTWDFAPGESATLIYDGQRVYARRLAVIVLGEQSGKRLTLGGEEPEEIAPAEGYLATKPHVYTIRVD